jgi:cystathionine gamma-lyase/cystathionine beta-lyase/cystathionine gamma-lyase/homocysteine desulfhydrase
VTPLRGRGRKAKDPGKLPEPLREGKARRGFATEAIHAGQPPDAATGAVIPPVYFTSTYARPSLDEPAPHGYARISHPTRAALETCVAVLERGESGHAFASGMAAIEAVFSLLRAGEHAVVSEDSYGGTYRLCERLLVDRGVRVSWVDSSDLEAIEGAMRPETRLAFIESPTNPLLRLSDIAAIAKICRARRVPLAVDNTFLSPFLQQPLALGADLALHSTTKFLNGHSDVVGGVVVARTRELGERLRFIQQSAGAIPGPLDCFLVLRGIKTLALRMERHDASGQIVASYLAADPRAGTVHYPGLASHPQHDLAMRQARGFGGVLSFDLRSIARARAFLGGLTLCTLAESLGGVETLISHPATMSHASLPKPERRRLGIGEGLLRLSVGLEDIEDILADLEAGLAQV